MADVGISFIFRASTAAFTRGVAAANNSLQGLKKSLREFDVGMGLRQLIGVGGAVQLFRGTINAAQEMRAEFEKLGKAVPDSIASVARLGDSFEQVKRSVASLAVETLSYFTRAGEAVGGYINRLRGITEEQEKARESAARAADEAERRLAAAREANSPEKQAAADKALAASERRLSNKAEGPERKMVDLINERADLEAELETVGKATVRAKEIRAKLNDNQAALDAAGRESDEQAARAKEQETAKQEAIKRQRLNKVALTVEELAAQETGGFTDANDPRLRARRALELEGRARILGERGDIKGALELQGKAEGIRQSLEGVSATSQVLTPATAKTAFEEALTKTNEELASLKEAVGGIIKAQK